MAMKKALLEKSFVVVLFVLVIIIFSFAERDTQKAFEKYNQKSTVEITNASLHYAANNLEKPAYKNKAIRY